MNEGLRTSSLGIYIYELRISLLGGKNDQRKRTVEVYSIFIHVQPSLKGAKSQDH